MTLQTTALRLFIAVVLASLSACASDPVAEEQQAKAVRNRVVAGLEYLQLGQPGEARRHLNRAIEIDPGSAEAHNAMALLYKYEGDHERERIHLRKALRAEPDFGAARNNYGAYFLEQGDLPNALKHFRRAAENPTYSGRGVAYENMGRVLVQQERTEEAIDAFNKSLRLNPGAIQPVLELADLYLQRERTDVAARYYSRYATEVNPQSPRGLWIGIRIATAEGDDDKRASYELALQKLYPKSREYDAWQQWKKARGGS